MKYCSLFQITLDRQSDLKGTLDQEVNSMLEIYIKIILCHTKLMSSFNDHGIFKDEECRKVVGNVWCCWFGIESLPSRLKSCFSHRGTWFF